MVLSMSTRQSKTSLREMLTRPDPTLDGELNAPALLLRKLLHELGIKPIEWETLTSAYYKKKWGDDVKKIREEKSNLATSLESDTVTWSRFEQVLQILGPDSVDFTVALKYPKDITLDATVGLRFRRRGSKVDPEITVMVDRMAEVNDDDREEEESDDGSQS